MATDKLTALLTRAANGDADAAAAFLRARAVRARAAERVTSSARAAALRMIRTDW
ncbi:hypothetical protein [Streptomyces lavendulae]|uniref:hypothetical protein n=1 Tax=Streptomyces lavendulae TaxID=1914 RepID=UPI0024A211B1|nr:hypothetical protein [Streptomyces lavendulae]GLX22651.1 hypothetical protein Slala01_62950 [Streptomyces lavendulae subsp. lavendulae]GLX30134.1 hypothetical protein Slala02_59540 [Streptomyces lavendulae subsp. lavendulae]